MNRLQRFYMQVQNIITKRDLRTHSVNVEQFLLDIANGKRKQVLGGQDLREIALYLGDPTREKPACMR